MAIGVVTVPSPALNPVATRLARAQLGDCVEVEGLDLDVGAWPAVGRSVVGGLQDVTVDADRMSVGRLTVRDVSARFQRVSAGHPGNLDVVAVRGGMLQATITERDLAAALPSSLVSVQLLPGGVVLHVPLVPAVAFDVAAEAGDVVLHPRLAGAPLATVRIEFPEPVRLRHVRTAAGRLELSATVDGDIDLADLGC